MQRGGVIRVEPAIEHSGVVYYVASIASMTIHMLGSSRLIFFESLDECLSRYPTMWMAVVVEIVTVSMRTTFVQLCLPSSPRADPTRSCPKVEGADTQHELNKYDLCYVSVTIKLFITNLNPRFNELNSWFL